MESSTLPSDNQTGDTIRDARARCQKCDAHDNIRNAKRVSDDCHLGDSVGGEVNEENERERMYCSSRTIHTIRYEKTAIQTVERIKDSMKYFSQRDLAQFGMVKYKINSNGQEISHLVMFIQPPEI